MKKLFAFLISSTFMFAAQAAEQSANLTSDRTPKTVGANYTNLYVAKGFDSNDNVQITGEGSFTNSCFKVAPPIVKVDEAAKIITLEAQAYQYSGMCMQVKIPFQQTVDLGLIKAAGIYKVQNAEGKVIAEVEVAPARTTEADDFFYAPVQQLKFLDGESEKLTLRVEFNNSCLHLSEVKVDKQENVIVIQPITKFAPDFGCAMGYFPVVKTISLGDLKSGRYLIHVRSSGSQAHNQIIAVD